MFFYAREKREETKAWQMWLLKWQNMDENNYTSFENFYATATSRETKETKVSARSATEILEDAKRIREKVKKGRV